MTPSVVITGAESASTVTVFHGTTSNFTQFADLHLGGASGHTSSVLGHFFSTSPAIARTFCLHPDLLDKAYDTNLGSRSLLSERWLARNLAEGSILPNAAIVSAYLEPKRSAIMGAVEFAARCDDDEIDDRAWQRLKDRLISQGYDTLLVKADEEAVSRGDLCMEYLSDIWVALDPRIIKVIDRQQPLFPEPQAHFSP